MKLHTDASTMTVTIHVNKCYDIEDIWYKN